MPISAPISAARAAAAFSSASASRSAALGAAGGAGGAEVCGAAAFDPRSPMSPRSPTTPIFSCGACFVSSAMIKVSSVDDAGGFHAIRAPDKVDLFFQLVVSQARPRAVLFAEFVVILHRLVVPLRLAGQVL